jgi:type 1 glutamine amidotransferase
MRFVAWATVLSAGLLAAAPSSPGGPIPALLITGQSDLPHHRWQETTACLRETLSGRFDLRVTEEPRGLTAAALAGYAVVVLNYNGPRLPRTAEEALEAFVRNGGGLASFHQGSYGTFFGMEEREGRWRDGPPGAGWSAYQQMIGVTWPAADLGHARRGVFTVEWKDAAHPVPRGLPASFVANDELYHKLRLAPSVEVLADALSPPDQGGTGRREPLIWTHRYGKGRIFFTTLGHDAMAWYQQGLRQAFARGVEWAARGEVAAAEAAEPPPVRLLVVTSGHSYPTSFYAAVDSLPRVRWTHAASHAEAFGRPLEERYDAILLHDMHESASETARARLKAFVEAGKGVVSLHHAIVNYTDWPYWYEEVTGGKYFVKPVPGHDASRYHEDVDFLVTPVRSKERHPVLRGVGPLWVNDELYRGMYLSPRIEVLMETTHPENDRPVVYVGPHARARVVYIQLGHSDATMKHPGFRRLLRNAVAWVARREEER